MATTPTTPPPAYFLSLSLENVRSFGKKQTISFATAEGRPAQWTIILGNNGVGKTTVLKALAGMTRGTRKDENGALHMWRYIDKLWNPTRKQGDSWTHITAENSVDLFLSDNKKVSSGLRFSVQIRSNTNGRGSGNY